MVVGANVARVDVSKIAVLLQIEVGNRAGDVLPSTSLSYTRLLYSE